MYRYNTIQYACQTSQGGASSKASPLAIEQVEFLLYNIF